MATVYSDQFTSAGVPVKTQREPHSGLFYRKAVFASPVSGNGTAAADIIQMIPVRKGTTVIDVILTSEDLDTDASPTHQMDVGDGDDVDRYIDGSLIGGTGGTAAVARIGTLVAAAAADGVFYTYTADDTIDVKIVAASTAKAAGNITLVAILSMEDA